MRMVLASHVIFCLYGFWLPNDQRGSWSDFVGSWDLLRYGFATKTTLRRSLAHDRHDRELRKATKSALDYPPVKFTGLQALAVGRGFAKHFLKSKVLVWACAILPDHVHMVVGRPGISVEQLVIQLKGAATRELELEGIHPMGKYKRDGEQVPKCWVRGQWTVYLDPDDVQRAIGYVEGNPLKEGKRRQSWSFAVPYGAGHLG